MLKKRINLTWDINLEILEHVFWMGSNRDFNIFPHDYSLCKTATTEHIKYGLTKLFDVWKEVKNVENSFLNRDNLQSRLVLYFYSGMNLRSSLICFSGMFSFSDLS